MTLTRFISALEELKADLYIEDVLDALWLAQLGRKLTLQQTTGPLLHSIPNSGEASETNYGVQQEGGAPPVGDPERNEKTSIPQTSDFTSVYAPGNGEFDSPSQRASPVAIPSGRALHRRLEFTRAMRPFSRKWQSRCEAELDEQRTVELTAELGMYLYPVFRPVQEYWFDVDVVLEDDLAVLVWQDTVRDFCIMLRDTGAFRDVRRWRLRLDEKEPALESLPGGGRSSARLLNGIGGRRLIFFATHGSSAHWNDGVYAAILDGWRSGSSIVVLQLQPSHRWKRSTLGEAQGEALALEPGGPTSSLHIEPYWWSLAATSGEDTLVPVPVVPLDPKALSEWANMQMARGRRCPAVFLDKETSESGEEVYGYNALVGSAARHLKLLLESSPDAYRLAVYLASGPFTLPVARLVQEAMFGGTAEQAHLADVLLCEVVSRRPGQDSEADYNRIYYEFTPEARTILLRSLHEDDAKQITQSLEGYVSKYIAQIFGRDITFQALVPDDDGKFALPEWVQPFAKLGVSLLGLPPSIRSIRTLFEDFCTTCSPRVIRQAAMTARAGEVPVPYLTKLLVSAGLARETANGIQWMPGAETLLKETPPLRGANVLLIDDYPERNLEIANRIRDAGAKIREIGSVDGALGTLEWPEFDLVITDISDAQATAGPGNFVWHRSDIIFPHIIIYSGNVSSRYTDDWRRPPRWAFGCTNKQNELFELVCKAAVTQPLEPTTPKPNLSIREIEAVLRAPGDRHVAFQRLLGLLSKYCNSSINQLFVHRDGKLTVIAEVIEPGKRRYDVASWEGIIGRAAKSKAPVWISDVLNAPEYIAAEPSTCSECTIPLLSGTELLGVLNVEMTRTNALTQTQVEWLVTLSEPIALALAAARSPRMFFHGRVEGIPRRIITDLARYGIRAEVLASLDGRVDPLTVVLVPISSASTKSNQSTIPTLENSWILPLLLEDVLVPPQLSSFPIIDFTYDYKTAFGELLTRLRSGGAGAGLNDAVILQGRARTPATVSNIVEIHFATNRKILSDGSYGADGGELSYGMCAVSVPPMHRTGRLEQRSWWRFELRDDPDKHFVLVERRPLPALSLTGRRVLIFIHDWNTTFEDSVLRFAQIVHDLAADVTPLLFSWPSRGEASGYLVDIERAETSARLLLNVLAMPMSAPSLVVWAHGAGCRAVLGVLKGRRIPVDHIIFTEPDVDEDWFRERIRDADYTGARMTVYTDPSASRLGVQGLKKSNAASATRPFPGADLIVISGTPLADIAQLLKYDMPPERRFGLRAVHSESGIRWELSSQSSPETEWKPSSALGTVYIASTLMDLKDYREIAAEAIRQAGCVPIRLESESARDSSVLATAFDMLARADAVVVILDNRQGFVPSDQQPGDQKSLTWLECEEAIRLRKHIFALTRDNRRLEVSSEVRDFTAWLSSQVVISAFAGPEDFRGKLISSLVQWRRNDSLAMSSIDVVSKEVKIGQDERQITSVGPSRYILLAGSRRSSPVARIRRETEWAAEAIGKEIARAGLGLVCGAESGADRIASAAFVSEMVAKQLNPVPALRIVTYVKNLESLQLPEGIPVQYTDDQVSTSLAIADAVILLGGNAWVRQVAASASLLGKRVFPIPGTGEAAARLFDEHVGTGASHRDLPWSRSIERKKDAEAVAAAVIREITDSGTKRDEDWIAEAVGMVHEALQQRQPNLALELLRERPDLWQADGLLPVVNTTARAVLQEFAQQYEEIRRTQPAGDSRTASMNRLVSDVIDAVRAIPLDRTTAQELFNENGEGTRIVGIAVAQGRPYAEHVGLATRSIRNSLSPFEQFNALSLARVVVDLASADDREDLRDALLHQTGIPIHQSDRSRADIKLELLEKIDAGTNNRRLLSQSANYDLVTIISPDQVYYSDDPGKHHGDFVRTRGRHQLELPREFRIGSYPVTNEQFLAFVDDHGYEEDRYWQKRSRRNFLTKDGRTRGPATWDLSRAHPLGQGKHPVSGISYLEARAFVLWLQVRYPEPGWTWRLPSEDMWELTARSTEGYSYPWGETFQAGYCNFKNAGIGGSSEITRFPLGKSVYGCSDMAGNVWEFVEASDKTNGTCVLRGGSYRNDSDEIKNCFRLQRVPVDHRAEDFGLRCTQVRNALTPPAKEKAPPLP